MVMVMLVDKIISLGNWKAGGSSNTFNVDGVGYATAAAASMNTGTITPTGCSVNTEAGFSIVKFTGTGNASGYSISWSWGRPKSSDVQRY